MGSTWWSSQLGLGLDLLEGTAGRLAGGGSHTSARAASHSHSCLSLGAKVRWLLVPSTGTSSCMSCGGPRGKEEEGGGGRGVRGKEGSS